MAIRERRDEAITQTGRITLFCQTVGDYLLYFILYSSSRSGHEYSPKHVYFEPNLKHTLRVKCFYV